MDFSRIPEPLRSRLEDQLSRLPPEVRATLESKLANLPVNQLEAVLQRTAPLLQKLASKQGGKGHGSAGAGSVGVASAHKAQRPPGAGTASATGSTTGQAPIRTSVFDQHNHYSNTVGRGDGDSPPFFVILFVIACALGFASTFGWM
jgi:hypothetical protein